MTKELRTAVYITRRDLRKAVTEVQLDLMRDDRLDGPQRLAATSLVALVGLKLMINLFEETD